ncbi:MAG: hypothetical protein J6128_00450 [Clostridia bacterium]|nr:hypothetical protein [Clostridia bacterium]
MKRHIAVILMLVIAFSLAGCGTQPIQETEEETGPESEYVIPGNDKELLPLQFMPVFEEDLEPEPPAFEEILLECPDIPETMQTRYGTDMGLDVFADYIADRFGIYIDGSWKAFVHYYNIEQTSGMAEFMYTVGEINTNKAVLFQLEDGKAVRVYYKNLENALDENSLLERVDMFRQRYEQEQPVLGDDEHLEEEKISYTYYYGTDKLVYCYNVFFSYGEHRVINNDWGTQCYINEEGEAVFFKMTSAEEM